MDFCPNPPISLSKERRFPTHTTEEAPPTPNGGLSHLLPQQPIEGDENSEWLSVFVEDCFSSSGNYLLAPADEKQVITKASTQNPVETLKTQSPKNPTKKTGKKVRTRSIMKVKSHKIPSIFNLEDFITELDPDPDPDPPLLHQAHWLADSEPIFPIKQDPSSEKLDLCEEKLVDVAVELSLASEHYIEPKSEKKKKNVLKHRKCSHCQAEKTPLWRQGPLGKGTLCNACGVRWLKTGNLFPEYRPANSPTFVSNLHSNVLRKVLQMREAREASGASES
ncbi:hypothetical protein Cgig2_031804 [Carnegiea gigantea]|uniref:GATA-type domain-containing protein n=1 Tax=Carnegiea gigantea TaxID=171969 RepID=A0A9Q1QPZ7_9CARY|nr:hypothetical protein Cgig2_031804 [Carnegiea gigantea]